MAEMRIAVVGAGGVGGHFGAKLARGGADVVFIARGAHLDALQRDGLRIEGGGEPLFVAPVQATSDPGEVGHVDLVMLCVKLWDSERTLRQIRPLVGPRTTLVSLQNGVHKDGYLRSAYPEAHLIGGVAYVASAIARPGVIRRTGPLERLVLGEFDGRRSRLVEALHELAIGGGVNVEISSDVWREIWEKFVFLVGLSAATTTMRTTIGPIREHPDARAFLLDVMREVVAVGRARGVDLPADYAEQRLELTDGLARDMTSSMHHDLEHGRPLELRWLSGGVAALARESGLQAPLNRAVTDILCLYENGGKTP